MRNRERPSRSQLERRLQLLKRWVIVLAVGSFVTVAGLAAEKASATIQAPSSRQRQSQVTTPYFGSTGGDSGTLGGSDSPPVAGSHAS